MSDRYLVEPDVGFIKEVGDLGGGDLKKCFQCATCSVVCPISPENKPFPRKEMISASWGLKDKVVGSADIWLCHNCGDCTTKCPRGAHPGEVLGALRAYTIGAYAKPQALAKAVANPKMLPILFAIPAIIILVLGKITGLMHLNPGGDTIVHGHFISTWLVDLIFVPSSIWLVACFALSLKRFVADIHENAVLEGKTTKTTLDVGGIILSLIKVLPTILAHKKFDECGENKERAVAHMMVFFGFIGLFIVTSIFFVAIYILGEHGPYSQMNPVKWLANVSAVSLIVGGILLYKNRKAKTDQKSSYFDWYLLILVLGLGITGMGSQTTRLAGYATLSYWTYFVHLMFVFVLFVYLPFSKLAHMVYRTTAMAYMDWAGRK